MPVVFEIRPDDHYFLCTYSGRIGEKEIVTEYEKFLSENDSMGSFRELCDMSSCDLSEITLQCLRQLSALVESFCERNRITEAKCACYCPKKINHSVMQLYDSASKGSAEKTRIFTTWADAISWLQE